MCLHSMHDKLAKFSSGASVESREPLDPAVAASHWSKDVVCKPMTSMVDMLHMLHPTHDMHASHTKVAAIVCTGKTLARRQQMWDQNPLTCLSCCSPTYLAASQSSPTTVSSLVVSHVSKSPTPLSPCCQLAPLNLGDEEIQAVHNKVA